MKILFKEMEKIVSSAAGIVIQKIPSYVDQVDVAIANDNLDGAFTALKSGLGLVTELIPLIPEGPLRSAWINISYKNAATIENIESGSSTMSDVVTFFKSVDYDLYSALNEVSGVTGGSDQSYGKLV